VQLRELRPLLRKNSLTRAGDSGGEIKDSEEEMADLGKKKTGGGGGGKGHLRGGGKRAVLSIEVKEDAD